LGVRTDLIEALLLQLVVIEETSVAGIYPRLSHLYVDELYGG